MIPPLVLRIYADSTGLKAGLSKSVAQTKAATTAMTTQYNGFGKAVTKTNATAATSSSKLAQGLKANAGLIKVALGAAVVAGVAVAVKAASDLNEQLNRTKEVFEGSSGAIIAFSENTATGMGIAQAEALKAASNFGAMFDSADIAEAKSAEMSKTLIQLAADMASFNDQDPSEMLERLQGGLAGMARPLRNFGVFISASRVEAELLATGMEKVNGEFTDAQKVQARYNIILKDTKKQQGDFQRTLGHSFPNQLRVLRAQLIDFAATIGKLVLPAVTGLLKVVNFLLAPLQAIADVLADDSWTRFGAALEEAGLRTDQVTTKIRDMKKAMDESNASGRMLGGAMAAVERQTARAAEEAEGWAMRQRAVQVEMNHTTSRSSRMAGAMRRFLGMTEDDFKKWETEVSGKVGGVKAVLDSLAGKAHLTAKEVIKAFRKQLKGIQDFNANFQAVVARNIPADVLTQITDMADGGAAMLELLAGASNKQFRKIIAEMQKVQNASPGIVSAIGDIRHALLLLQGSYTVNVAFKTTGSDPRQRQHGGPVSAMQPYIVGERGPELFVPHASGTVVPNDKLAAASSSQPINIYLGDEILERVVVRGMNRAAVRA
jgi:hypothetical protein